MAFRGQLLPQVEGDDFASREQIERRAQKQGTKGAGGRHHYSAAMLPEGWREVTADGLFSFVTSGSRGWAAHYANDGAIFLRIGNLDYGTIDLDLTSVQYVQPPKGAEGTRTRVREGDILVSITGDTGMIGIIPNGFPEAYINQHIALARPSETELPRYLAMFFTSPSARATLRKSQRGVKNLSLIHI